MEKDKGIIITNLDKQKQCGIHVVMQWVVCKEELPKEDGDYLINWDGTVIEAGYYVDQNLWHDYTVGKYEKVTHWMRLPKPPCA